jgi:hypothetical protein
MCPVVLVTELGLNSVVMFCLFLFFVLGLSRQLRDELVECIDAMLINGRMDELTEYFTLRGSDVNPKLKALLEQLLQQNLESWKEASAMDRVTLPRLQDFDWSLQFQRASTTVRKCVDGLDISHFDASFPVLLDSRHANTIGVAVVVGGKFTHNDYGVAQY